MRLSLAPHCRTTTIFQQTAANKKRVSFYHASHFSTSAPFYLSRTLPTFRNMEVELTAPNGKKWTQPLGLFVNNEFIKSSNDQKLASINPA